MTEGKKVTTFEELYERDITKYVEKLEKKYKDKNGNQRSFFLSYLSWAYGHREMKRIDPDAKEIVHTFPLIINGQAADGIEVPYLQTPQGFFVKTSVTINERTESEWLPVLDQSNKPLANPNSFQINNSHKRCFVKALAKHGLGLYLYIGEDLPEKIEEQQTNSNENQTGKNQQHEQQPMPPNVNELNDRITFTMEEIKKIGGNMGIIRQQFMQAMGLENMDNYNKMDLLKFLQGTLNDMKQHQNEQGSLFEGRTTKPATSGTNWGAN